MVGTAVATATTRQKAGSAGLASARPGILWSWMALHDAAGAGLMTPETLSMLGAAVTSGCDALDGVVDGVIDDPRRCRFDPAALRCHGADGAGCLTDAQVEAVRKVYAGPDNPRTGERVFAGWSRGSEAIGDGGDGWAGYLLRPSEPMRLGYWANWVFGPHTFDALSALEQWVEAGVAPDRIVASKMVDGVAARTRPLCPYPQVARYTGEGSTDKAENFRCVVPAG